MRATFDFRQSALCATALVVWLATCGSAPGQDAPSGEPATADVGQAAAPEQIAAWIKLLDSDQYQAREQATQRLVSAGIAALEPLLAAANGDRPEPADRAVWILRRMANSKDQDLRLGSLEKLVLLENQPEIAAEAEEELSKIRHAQAVAALQQLGARYLPEGPDAQWGRVLRTRVVLDDHWRGGDEGLDHVAQLLDVPLIIVIGSDISPAGFTKLQQVESLHYLWLFGTTLEDKDVAELQRLMPGVEFDYRRGALLGVRGSDVPNAGGQAKVDSVQPGTAADAAGIRKNDIIRTFDAQPVASFQDLTEKIAKHRPGDEVKIEILRGNETVDMTVKLGRWEGR